MARDLGLPLIVKPANEGSTLGLTKVTAVSQLPAAYELAANKYHDTALAESFIDGPEYTAGILGDAALPLIRIEAPQGNYDYQHKYFGDDTKYSVPLRPAAAAGRHGSRRCRSRPSGCSVAAAGGGSTSCSTRRASRGCSRSIPRPA